jgi:hypothetical protein
MEHEEVINEFTLFNTWDVHPSVDEDLFLVCPTCGEAVDVPGSDAGATIGTLRHLARSHHHKKHISDEGKHDEHN